MKPSARCLLTTVAATSFASAQPPSPVMDPPRAFGYVIGDLVPLAAEFTVPAGCEPVLGSLPQSGRIDYWLQLRRSELKNLGGGRYRFERVYQTFFAPLEVKTLTIPKVDIAYRCGHATDTLGMPAWSFTMAPIRQVAVGKGEDDRYMRPDKTPAAPSLARHWLKLSAWITAALSFAAALAWRDGWFPWLGRRPAFALALRSLHKLAREPLIGTRLLEAYALLHEALNLTHGKPLFADHLDDFLGAKPAWSDLKPLLQAFFDASYTVHFGAAEGESPADYPPHRLLELAAACRQRERSA